MKKIFAKKYLSIGSIALLLFFGLTQFAEADNPITSAVASAFNNIGYVVIGKIAFGISYLIAWVAGVVISIEAWLVGAMLGINQGVFQADIVQKGFGATLSIANLGFVLGIIIVAIATILRSETYGYKKVLWKLIAAAILINFSLVIAAPIFSLGNSFTTYFLNCIDPGGGGCSGQGAGVSLTGKNSMNDFAAGLAGAFNPQVGLLGSNGTLSANTNNVPNSVSLGQSFGQMLVPILSIAFVAFELVAIVIVLAALVVMLLIRYIYIAILAILMPFAWLGWVFPNIKDWWSKWWNQFIRWTFFAPIVVFFLWLAMSTAQSMRNGTAIANQQFGTYTSTSNPIWAPISNLLTNTFNPIIAQVLNTLLMIGLSVAGIIVADRLSIAGAKAGVNAVKGAGKAGGVWMAKVGARGALKTSAWAARRTGARVGGPLGGAMGGVSAKLNTWAGHQSLKTGPAGAPLTGAGIGGFVRGVGSNMASKTGGLAKTVFLGAKNGSGLFKKAGVKDWECQNCAVAGLTPQIERSTKKPTKACVTCGAPNGTGPGMTDWKEV